MGKKDERMEDKSIREGPCSCRADRLSKGQQLRYMGWVREGQKLLTGAWGVGRIQIMLVIMTRVLNTLE